MNPTNDTATRKELAQQVASANERANTAEEALAVEKAKTAATEERLARLEAALLAPTQPGSVPAAPAATTLDEQSIARLMAAAVKELQESRPQMAVPFQAPTGPMPVLKPYRGYVRATADCTSPDGTYRCGPGSTPSCMNQIGPIDPEGEVFLIEVAQLWSDDPFVPVIQHNNSFIPHPKTSEITLNAHWRARFPVEALTIRAA